jgi:hypothetical protein
VRQKERKDERKERDRGKEGICKERWKKGREGGREKERKTMTLNFFLPLEDKQEKNSILFSLPGFSLHA